jgi:hypothetical protein
MIVTEQMSDVLFVPSEKVIKANNFVTLFDQSVAKVATEESGSSCY